MDYPQPYNTSTQVGNPINPPVGVVHTSRNLEQATTRELDTMTTKSANLQNKADTKADNFTTNPRDVIAERMDYAARDFMANAVQYPLKDLVGLTNHVPATVFRRIDDARIWGAIGKVAKESIEKHPGAVQFNIHAVNAVLLAQGDLDNAAIQIRWHQIVVHGKETDLLKLADVQDIAQRLAEDSFRYALGVGTGKWSDILGYTFEEATTMYKRLSDDLHKRRTTAEGIIRANESRTVTNTGLQAVSAPEVA